MGSEDEYLSDVEETLDDDVEDTLDDDECGDFESPDDGSESDKTNDDRREKGYTVLEEEDIRKLQEEEITKTSAGLSIPRISATILLQYYNWDADKALDAWFADEEKVRKEVGLLEVLPTRNPDNIIECTICFDEFRHDGMCATTCGHLFCKFCWTQYVSIKISDGPVCLRLRCPEPSCGTAVGQDMINELVSDEDKEKYSRYLLRSYVEDRKNTKWCPGPGCEYAVDFVAGSSSYDVVCSCLHNFCWDCLDDAHRPVDCDTVHNWAVKNTAESENVTWILANSKSCPKCKKPIQKNEGCMHMTCYCKFEFCWLCLGGFYACNVYEKAKAGGVYDEEEKIKKKAKDYLDRYMFYFERYAENHKSRLKAVESLKKIQSEDIPKLSERYFLPETQLGYITDAWQQIIECRRVLKWSYAYGFYLPQSEHAKKNIFDYSQGEAESWLERLHQCAEQELQTYLKQDKSDDATEVYSSEDFETFHQKLLTLTKATRTYFENLVRALENGLP
ncbi:hypothetical protein MKW92_009626, partial [Papaver armeniacum]